MILIKIQPNKDIDIPIPYDARKIIGGYFWVNANLLDYSSMKIFEYSMIEITNEQLISDLNKLHYTIRDNGDVCHLTSGLNPWSDPLAGDDLDSWMRGTKYIAKKNAAFFYESKFTALSATESNLESASWSQQLAEAKTYQNDNTAVTPLLSALATARNLTISEYAANIINASNKFNEAMKALLVELKTQYQIIDDAVTPLELKNTSWV